MTSWDAQILVVWTFYGFSFLCVCLVNDHEFRHSIVERAVGSQTTLTMLWRNSLSITGQTHDKLTSIWTNISYKLMCLSSYWQWNLANERPRISAIIVKCLWWAWALVRVRSQTSILTLVTSLVLPRSEHGVLLLAHLSYTITFVSAAKNL